MLFVQMDEIKHLVWTFFVLICAPLCGLNVESHAQGWLHVSSNLEGATVVLDSVSLGQVGSSFECLPGRHTVYLLPPIQDSWFFTRPSAEVEIRSGDTTAVNLDFPYVYHLESNPDDAQVLLISENGHISLGATPLLLRREHPVEAELVFKKQGYHAKRLTPDAGVLNQLLVELQPK
jgi:hypothetical protein